MSLTSAFAKLPDPLHAMVVGGTAGIGMGVAQQLSTLSAARVTIVGRNATAGAKIASEAVNGNVTFKSVDAASMKAIKAFCDELVEEFKSSGKQLDILVLTQGVMGYKTILTSEGLSHGVALNYYGRMLFIRELSSILSAHAIIISVLNGKIGDPSGNTLAWGDMGSLKDYSLLTVPKLLNHNTSMTDIMLQALAEGSTRTFIHADPGAVATNLLRKSSLPLPLKLFMGIGFVLFAPRSPAAEGELMLLGATEARGICMETGQSWFAMGDKGQFFHKAKSDAETRRKVSQHTWELVEEALRR